MTAKESVGKFFEQELLLGNENYHRREFYR